MKHDILKGDGRELAEATCEIHVDDATPAPLPRAKRRSQTKPAASEASLENEAPLSAMPLGKFNRFELAYQEFCRRREQGEDVDPDAYCAEFPSIRSSLANFLHAQMLLEGHPSVFAEPPPGRWPVAGETFHDYQLKLVLGVGAFARVYLATEPKLGNRLVAVKVSPHGASEADVLGRIQHPNIVPVHSVQEDKPSGLTAVCMPYVGSATLHDVLDRAFPSDAGTGTMPQQARVVLEVAEELPYPLDPSARHDAANPLLRKGTYVDAVRLIGAQLAEALAYLHANGICHRDLKPSNVLLSPTGVPLLLDFNLCADSRRTLNQLGGTMPYMSPEQLHACDAKESGDTLDARSDIFSLGVILYLLLTGRNPFGPIPWQLKIADLRRHMIERQQAGVAEARSVNPNVDAAFSRLIQRCLALDPKDRPQTAAEVASALRGALAPLPRTKRWIARHPWLSAAALLLLAFVSLGGIGLAAMRQPHSERQLDAGMRHYRDRRYQQAVEHFNDVLQTDPNHRTARLARGHAHQQLGAYNLAMQDYLEADRRNPDGRARAALGYCLNRTKGRPEAALHEYEQAIQAGFATAAVHNNLGYTFMELGTRQSANARKHFDRAIELDPNLQSAHHNRAVLTFRLAPGEKTLTQPAAKTSDAYRDLKAGIADAHKAMDLGPASAELYFNAACLCALAANVDDKWKETAMRHLEDAVKHGLDPKKCAGTVFRPLQDQARHQALINRPAEQPAAQAPTRRLADPIQDSVR